MSEFCRERCPNSPPAKCFISWVSPRVCCGIPTEFRAVWFLSSADDLCVGKQFSTFALQVNRQGKTWIIKTEIQNNHFLLFPTKWQLGTEEETLTSPVSFWPSFSSLLHCICPIRTPILRHFHVLLLYVVYSITLFPSWFY